MAHNSEGFFLIPLLMAYLLLETSRVFCFFFLCTDFEQELELLVLDAQGG